MNSYITPPFAGSWSLKTVVSLIKKNTSRWWVIPDEKKRVLQHVNDLLSLGELKIKT